MPKKIAVLVGSLRGGSFARKIATHALELFPEGFEAEIVEIGHLPLYNFDYDDPETLRLTTTPTASPPTWNASPC